MDSRGVGDVVYVWRYTALSVLLAVYCAVLWSRLILENMAGPKLPGAGAQHHQSSSSANHWGCAAGMKLAATCVFGYKSLVHVKLHVYLSEDMEVQYVYTQL